MKKRIFALLAALFIALGCLAGCSGNEEPVVETQGSGTQQAEWVDYAASIPLDMSSETAKQEVTVKAFVDGDTTHFNVPGSISAGGLLKARYLAVNTPESTGKIEEYGKKASQSPAWKVPIPSTLNPMTPTGMSIPPAAVIWFGYGTDLPAAIHTAI